MNMVLASGSPRRKELLEMLGVKNMQIIPAKGVTCVTGKAFDVASLAFRV